MKKYPRNYRLSKKTVQQIKDLVSVMDSSDATAVITQAVQEKYLHFLEEHATHLKINRNGKYDVIKSGVKIGTVEGSYVDRIPEKRRKEFMGAGVLHGEIELLLDVAAGRTDNIELDPENLKKVSKEV